MIDKPCHPNTPCHPEQAECFREAKALAKSKDPLLPAPIKDPSRNSLQTLNRSRGNHEHSTPPLPNVKPLSHSGTRPQKEPAPSRQSPLRHVTKNLVSYPLASGDSRGIQPSEPHLDHRWDSYAARSALHCSSSLLI